MSWFSGRYQGLSAFPWITAQAERAIWMKRAQFINRTATMLMGTARRGIRPVFSRIPYWTAPLLLTVVATAQFFQVRNVGLSPWKGGGFGMFATVDSPSNRVLSGSGLDLDGDPVFVDVSGSLDDRTDSYVRTVPSRMTLEKVADELLRTPLIPSDVKLQVAYQQLHQGNLDRLSVSHQTPLTGDLVAYRKRDVTDPPISSLRVKQLKTVRLQIWRLRFDPLLTTLRAEPLGEPVEQEP